MHTTFLKTASAIALAAMINSVAIIPAANAALVETDTLYTQQLQTEAHKKIDAFLAQEGVVNQLVGWGVSPEEARARAAALSDAEAMQVSQQIDELPAGQAVGAILGAAVFIFLVLLITDILGLTKVFPFTRSVR
ncbi:MAG: PA2779 family protein [Alphaproteobacteria bacterium]|nr:PA2779 family protein [Alphaproteobacteria bacterium]